MADAPAGQDQASGEAAPAVDAALAIKFYRDMLLIRRFEEKAGQLYGMGLIGGFCHLYIGQEAVVDRHAGRSHREAIRSSPPIAITAICWPAAWTPKV